MCACVHVCGKAVTTDVHPCSTHNFDGVVLDFALGPKLVPVIEPLLSQLYGKLHEQNRQLLVVFPVCRWWRRYWCYVLACGFVFALLIGW
jgi:hypothetical protein